MIGRRCIALTQAVREAWTRFSSKRAEVVLCSFCTLGLSLPINGSEDYKISIKGLATDILVEQLKEEKGIDSLEQNVDNSSDEKEVSDVETDDKKDFCYE